MHLISPAIVNRNGNEIEIGRVFTEFNDKLVIIDGKNIKEHEYLIPKTKVKKSLSQNFRDSLKELEI